MHHYCTYFDENYLPRGLALYHSMMRHDPQARLWILCLSDRCREILMELDLPEIQPISLEQLHEADPGLDEAKENRSKVEYFFTCTAPLMNYVLARIEDRALATYLDSDMYFFENPDSVYREIGDRSIAIVPHRFPPHLAHLADRGIYNVGWVSIRNDANGRACARWWRDRCIEWCCDTVEPERFADQKYLDRWPDLFQGVVVLKHKGVNTAPYNLGNFTVKSEREKLWVDDEPLVIFHFHGFRQLSSFLYDPNLADYDTVATKVIRHEIYGEYIRALAGAKRRLRDYFPPGILYARFPKKPLRSPQPKLDPLRTLVNEWLLFKRQARQLLEGKRIVFIGGRVI